MSTKTEMIEAIAFHFAKKGQRMTNLKKVAIPKLEELVKKYNINVGETMIEVRESKYKENQEREKRDAELYRIKQQKMQERENKEKEQKARWEALTSEQKRQVKDFMYANYVKEVEASNALAILITDTEYEKFKKTGLKDWQLVRENETTLRVRGIIHSYNFIMSPETLEELEAEKCYEKNIYTAKEAQDLIQELYETPFTIRVKATKK